MRREYTAQDIEQVNSAEEQLRAKGLDEGTERIVNVLDEYFQANRSVPVTAAAIVKLVEAQPGLNWLSSAALEYRRIAAENPAVAATFMSWFSNQKTLINTGDQGFQNATNILAELRGRDVNSQTIREAIGRIEAPTSKFSTRKRPPLHYVPTFRPTDPRQHSSDGTGFLGKEVNEPGWKRIQRERKDRETAERAKQPGAATVTAASVAEAQDKARSLQGATHAETDQLQRIFVNSGTEIDWVQTLASRLQMQRQFQKHREVSRFTR